jgi:hypothetical protein
MDILTSRLLTGNAIEYGGNWTADKRADAHLHDLVMFWSVEAFGLYSI